MNKLTKQLLMIAAALGFSGLATAHVYAAQMVQPFEAEQTTANIEGVTITPNNQDDAPVETPTPDTNTFFHDKNVWVVGDSLSVGWDGAKNVQHPYPALLNDIIQAQTMHAGYASSGSQISGNSVGGGNNPVDLTPNMTRVTGDAEFKNANVLLLEIGVNDLDYSNNNLGYVQQRLQANIRTARQANPNIVIYGVLPVPAYQLGSTLDIKGKAGYSFNQLADSLTEVYQSFGIPVMDWRTTRIVTDDNHNTTLGDGKVHPTQATYAAMADTLSTWMYDNETLIEHDSTTTFTSKPGWQTTEQGDKQYVKGDGTLATGAMTIDGKNYFFDANHVAVTNQIVTINGKQYYIGTDGTRQQGIVLVNDKWHFFGSDKTYYERKFDQTGYLETNVGWRWFESGSVFSGFRYYMGTFYWFDKGVRQDAAWREAWNLKYYTDKDGRAVQGDAYNVAGTYYNFGHDGTYFLRGKASGYVLTNDADWLWIENGQRYTGFRMYMGAYYYFENGVRQQNKWVSEWGLKYYVGSDGRSVQGSHVKIGNQSYNFGTNGTFFLR